MGSVCAGCLRCYACTFLIDSCRLLCWFLAACNCCQVIKSHGYSCFCWQALTAPDSHLNKLYALPGRVHKFPGRAKVVHRDLAVGSYAPLLIPESCSPRRAHHFERMWATEDPYRLWDIISLMGRYKCRFQSLSFMHIYIYTHIYIYIPTPLLFYTPKHVYMPIQLYTHLYRYRSPFSVCVDIYVYAHTHDYTAIRLYIYTSMHTYIHTYIHICTHTYSHTRMYIYTHLALICAHIPVCVFASV